MKKVSLLLAVFLILPFVANGQSQVSATAKPTTSVSSSMMSCKFANPLAIGARGMEVSQLVKEGLLANDSITGYFGPVTAEAVGKFQEKNGLEKVKSVGKLTRERLNARCGNIPGNVGPQPIEPMYPIKPVEPVSPVKPTDPTKPVTWMPAPSARTEALAKELALKYKLSAEKLQKPDVCVTALKADVNSDKQVDVWDLVVLSNGYNLTQAQGADTRADFDKDGKIDFDDLLTMSQDIGKKICEVSNTPVDAYLSVLSPSKGEVYKEGEKIKITFMAGYDFKGPAKIKFYDHVGLEMSEVGWDISGKGTHSVEVTPGKGSGFNEAYDRFVGTFNVEVCDMGSVSDQKQKPRCAQGTYFKITDRSSYVPDPRPNTQSIKVTSPNGGEKIKTGRTTVITWESQNLGKSSRVNIDLLKKDRLTVVKRLAAGIPNSGKFNWKMTGLPEGTDDYVVYVSTVGPGALDSSDTYFTVTNTGNQETALEIAKEYAEKYNIDENQLTQTSSSACTSGSLRGDFNQDTKVDMWDLIILGDNYNKNVPGAYPAADINADGKVSFDELLALSQDFGKTSCSLQ
jgi:peptidoglycan hydrolase-like protein with peptidoglycan-binding domain